MTLATLLACCALAPHHQDKPVVVEYAEDARLDVLDRQDARLGWAVGWAGGWLLEVARDSHVAFLPRGAEDWSRPAPPAGRLRLLTYRAELEELAGGLLGLDLRGFGLNDRVRMRLERGVERLHFTADGFTSAEERPPLSSFEILRAVPREACWVTVHSLPDSYLESALHSLADLEEAWQPIVRSLGPVRAAYGIARGDSSDVVHLLQTEGDVADLWPDFLRLADEWVAVEELESEVPCLRVTISADPGPIEFVVAHDGVHLILTDRLETAVAAQVRTEDEAHSLIARPEIRAWAESCEGVHACGRLETRPLIALGRAWLEGIVRESMRRGGDESPSLRWLRFASTEPAPGAWDDGFDTIEWTYRDRGGHPYLLARLDRSISRTWLTLAGQLLTQPATSALRASWFAELPPLRDSRATPAEIEAELRRLGGALEHFARRNGGRLPAWLELLVLPDVNGNAYLDSLTTLVDPWGRDYGVEESESEATITVFTLGADGAVGGAGADADLRVEVRREP